MTLSLAITNFNRFELTIESFAHVIDDTRIDDIVILDDASTDGSFEKLVEYYQGVDKVRVIRQAQNRGMSINKRDAIGYAKNEWVIIFDSDNVIGKDYLDAFEKYTGGVHVLDDFFKRCIFCPDFAKPQFDYRKFTYPKHPTQGIFNQGDAAEWAKDDSFNCLLNTCNYIVNRDVYLNTYRHNAGHIASDTIWHNYNHLNAGGLFCVVNDMQYYHRVHKGSGFMQDVNYNMAQSEKVRKMIMAL